MKTLFKTILYNFIKRDILRNSEIHLIDFRDKNNFLEFDQIYLGIYVKNLILNPKLSKSEIHNIINNCANFYIEMLTQIRKRFDFEINFKSLSSINPNIIMNKRINTIFDILKEFPNFIDENDKQALDSEYRALQFLEFEHIFEKTEVSLCNFWQTISEIKQGDSTKAFPVLTEFVKQIMVLPHSSANVERIFSAVNLNKTKFRSSLENETLEGIIYSKDYLKLNKSNCFDAHIKYDLAKNLNSEIYS